MHAPVAKCYFSFENCKQMTRTWRTDDTRKNAMFKQVGRYAHNMTRICSAKIKCGRQSRM